MFPQTDYCTWRFSRTNRVTYRWESGGYSKIRKEQEPLQNFQRLVLFFSPREKTLLNETSFFCICGPKLTPRNESFRLQTLRQAVLFAFPHSSHFSHTHVCQIQCRHWSMITVLYYYIPPFCTVIHNVRASNLDHRHNRCDWLLLAGVSKHLIKVHATRQSLRWRTVILALR